MKRLSKKRYVSVLISACAIAAAVTYIILSVAGAFARARSAQRHIEPDYKRYLAQGYSFESVSEKVNILLTVTDDSKLIRAMLITLDKDKHTVDMLDLPVLSCVSADGFDGSLSQAYSLGFIKQATEAMLRLEINNTISASVEAIGTIVELLGGTNAYIDRTLSLDDKCIRKGIVSFDRAAAEFVLAEKSAYYNGDSNRLYQAFISSLMIKLSELGALESASKLIGVLLNEVETDMSVSDMIDLFSSSSSVSLDDISLHLLPGEMCYHNGEARYSTYLSDAATLLNKHFRVKDNEASSEALGAVELVNNNKKSSLPSKVSDYIKN